MSRPLCHLMFCGVSFALVPGAAVALVAIMLYVVKHTVKQSNRQTIEWCPLAVSGLWMMTTRKGKRRKRNTKDHYDDDAVDACEKERRNTPASQSVMDYEISLSLLPLIMMSSSPYLQISSHLQSSTPDLDCGWLFACWKWWTGLPIIPIEDRQLQLNNSQFNAALVARSSCGSICHSSHWPETSLSITKDT